MSSQSITLGETELYNGVIFHDVETLTYAASRIFEKIIHLARETQTYYECDWYNHALVLKELLSSDKAKQFRHIVFWLQVANASSFLSSDWATCEYMAKHVNRCYRFDVRLVGIDPTNNDVRVVITELRDRGRKLETTPKGL